MDEESKRGVRKDGRPYKQGNTLPDGTHKVGDRRPPVETRFASGDGRQRGKRDRGGRNFDTDWEEELTRSVVLIENGKKTKVSAHLAQVKLTMQRGGKGDHRAQQKIFDKADRLLGKAPKGPRLDDRDLIAKWLEQEQRNAPSGIVGDDLVGEKPPAEDVPGKA